MKDFKIRSLTVLRLAICTKYVSTKKTNNTHLRPNVKEAWERDNLTTNWVEFTGIKNSLGYEQQPIPWTAECFRQLGEDAGEKGLLENAATVQGF